MRITEVISELEALAHPSLQEPYDNCGLLVGNREGECTGIVCALDVTEAVIKEAVNTGCNLVVAHHPLIFGGLKGVVYGGDKNSYVERTVALAIRHDIAVYAIHTNLDNVIAGVNSTIAGRLGLLNTRILQPRPGSLQKLYTFVPIDHADRVRNAIFATGAGHIGGYDECSFNTTGSGTFRAGSAAKPFVGEVGHRHRENEIRIEVVLPFFLAPAIMAAIKSSHPYEEPAVDMITLTNTHPGIGSGMIGELPQPLAERDFLAILKNRFGTPSLRHSPTTGKRISKVAICGGAGSLLISNALRTGADAFVTADIKYHEFFDAIGRMLLVDIGHFESEQFTIDLLQAVLSKKFLNFAVLKTAVETNPVRYFH